MKSLQDNYLECFYGKINNTTPKGYKTIATAYGKLFKKFLPEKKDAFIIDVGCGPGYFLHFLNEEGYKDNSLGIDISQDQVDLCKEKGLEAYPYEALTYFKRLRLGGIDLVVMNDLLEHISKENIPELLREVHRSLAPEGKLLVKTLNMANPLGGYARHFDITHEVGFTEESLKQVLDTAGFSQVDIYPVVFSRKGKVIHYITRKVLTLAFWSQQLYRMPKIVAISQLAVAKK